MFAPVKHASGAIAAPWRVGENDVPSMWARATRLQPSGHGLRRAVTAPEPGSASHRYAPMKIAPLLCAALVCACAPAADDTDPPTQTAAQDSATATLDAPDAAPSPGQPAPMTEVPERFRGQYAQKAENCGPRFAAIPTQEPVTLRRQDVSFFETGGPVTHVEVDGDAIAVTLRETVGPDEHVRVIYLALNGDGTVRYRPGEGEDVRRYIRCGEQDAAQ